MATIWFLLAVMYILGGISHLPREWEIYESEDHPWYASRLELASCYVGGYTIIWRFIIWPFRLNKQPHPSET